MPEDDEEEEVIVFAETPPPDIKCSICLEVFRDPLITKCGHTFCSRCAFQTVESKQQCAVCRTDVRSADLSPNLLAQGIVDAQLIHCRYGCTWTDKPLGRREEHEAECESQPVVCPFAPERCDVMFKYELDEHVETCPYRDGTPKEAAAAERRRRRTDPYELFTYMTIWIMVLYFLYTSHFIGPKLHKAGPLLLVLFSLPILFIIGLAYYETSMLPSPDGATR